MAATAQILIDGLTIAINNRQGVNRLYFTFTILFIYSVFRSASRQLTVFKQYMLV